MTRVSPATFWTEPDARRATSKAALVYLIEGADGALSLTTAASKATHWFVDYGGFVAVQPYPGSTTRVVLLRGENVVPLVLEAAYMDRLFRDHFMAVNSGNVEFSETPPGDRFFSDDGSGNWVLSNTDASESFLALTIDDPNGNGVRIVPVPT